MVFNAAGRKSKAGCASQLGQLPQLTTADPSLRELCVLLARRLVLAPCTIESWEPIIGPAVIRRTRKSAPELTFRIVASAGLHQRDRERLTHRIVPIRRLH